MNPEEYEILKKKVNEYERVLMKKKLHSFVCVSCKKKEIPTLFIDDNDDISENMVNNQEKWTYSNGGVGTIHFGYGSSHDMSKYYVALCDECVLNLVEENILHKK